ncbi:MAG TPA: DUF445 domain-containing protein [Acidimicrobiales bacterium]|nr:DUF445 domain-containing protein [Acidimicrobiales bacterium]
MTTPALPTEAERAAALRTMKRRATGLLALVAIVFVVLTVADPDAWWAPAAFAGAQGGMVGGLADWFAVTALFRHPLGLPIPHTAIIRERKDQFGATLGGFVQDNFLSPDVVSERVRDAHVADRVAAWLADPVNAATVARNLVEGAVGALDVVQDEVVQRVLHDEIERALGRVDVAPLAGRLLTIATDDGRHRELLDVGLRGVITFLDEQREPLRERFGAQSPWWLPNAMEDRLFDRIVDGARALLASVVADPDHEFRDAIDERLAALAQRLQHDPELAERGDALKRELLDHAALRTWSTSLWEDLKAVLRAQAPVADSSLRLRTTEAVRSVGERLLQDDELRARLDGWAQAASRYVVEHYRGEIGGLITSTVARWDGAETSDKLELVLGRDLQFIRINGTVVGVLAGLALHALGGLLH